MSATGQELEVKFNLPDLASLEQRLVVQGARLLQARIHEVNLRFDTVDGALSRSYQVLRLRQDSAARLTYKGPGEDRDGVRQRQELEFTVSDFETARLFLEALGYQVIFMYEKYRATYEFDNVLVVLDEMPYGNFAEIEGPDGGSIQAAAGRLDLDWQRRILESYTVLFERAKVSLGLSFRDLSFANFAGLAVTAADLGVVPAALG